MTKTVFTFGRMNPPTIGHQKLIDKVKAEAVKQGAMPHVYLSHTQNANKDPLDYNSKIIYARKAFGPSVTKSTSKSIMQVLQELQKMGHTEVTLVVGSDRVKDFKTLLNKYNGKDFTFEKIKVISAGQRDPDAEGTAGMSATKIRGLAQAGELEEFGKGLPSTLKANDTKAIYNKVRKVMGITESIEIEDEDFEFSEDELNAFVAMTDLEALDENTDIDEDFEVFLGNLEEERQPLTVQQRLKIGRRMKRLAPKMARKRAIQRRKMADASHLEKRSRKAAIKLLRTRFAGKQGANYASLAPGAKISVDRIIQKKMGMIKTISKRLLPKVRKAEMDRLKNARSSKKVVGTANESFDMQFESFIGVEMILEDENKETNQKLVYMLRQAFTDATERQLVIRALKGGAKSLQNPKLRPFILKLLNRLLDATQSDPTMFVKMKDRLRRMSQDDSKKETEESVKIVESFKTKSAKSGIPLDVIFECFMREEDHNKGFNRVNSFIAGGKARELDADLAEKVNEATGNLKDACWTGYKAIGTKKKNGKIVPNCVPEENDLGEAKGDLTHFVYQNNAPASRMVVHKGDEASSKYWIKKNAKHYDHKGKNFVIFKGKVGSVKPSDIVKFKHIEEAKKLPPHLAKFFDKNGDLKKDAQKRMAKSGIKTGTITDVTPKGYGPKEERSTEFIDVTKKQKKLDQTSNEDVDAAKEKIAREKEADKVKHDTMMDRARTRETQVKNRSTNESIDDAFTAFLDEEGGAGEWGTDKLKKKYKKDTPNEEMSCCCGDESLAEAELEESEYKGRKVKLNNPSRSSDGKKKFYVYVKNEKGNIIKLGFGDPNMEIKRDDPARRKSFRARHSCDDNIGPKWKARYWSCYQWRAGAKVDN